MTQEYFTLNELAELAEDFVKVTGAEGLDELLSGPVQWVADVEPTSRKVA